MEENQIHKIINKLETNETQEDGQRIMHSTWILVIQVLVTFIVWTGILVLFISMNILTIDSIIFCIVTSMAIITSLVNKYIVVLLS